MDKPLLHQITRNSPPQFSMINNNNYLAHFNQMDPVLLLWLQKCRIANGIALKLSQLGYFTIKTILLLNPDNNKAEFLVTCKSDNDSNADLKKAARNNAN